MNERLTGARLLAICLAVAACPAAALATSSLDVSPDGPLDGPLDGPYSGPHDGPSGPSSSGLLAALTDGASVRRTARPSARPSDRATATDPCDTRSPSLDALGAAYFELGDVAPASEAGLPSLASLLARRDDPRRPTALRLHHLLERLEHGELGGGRGERVVCGGRGAHARDVTWLFDLEQLERVETLGGGTLLTAFESRHTVRSSVPGDRLVDGIVTAEAIGLPARSAWGVNADLESLSASRRFRRVGSRSPFCAATRTSPLFPDALHPRPGAESYPIVSNAFGARAERCGYLTEVVLDARTVGSTIEVEQRFYVGGIASERVIWRLDS